MADFKNLFNKLTDSLTNPQTFKDNPKNTKSTPGKGGQQRTTFGGNAAAKPGERKKPGEKTKKSSIAVKEERLDDEVDSPGGGGAGGGPGGGGSPGSGGKPGEPQGSRPGGGKSRQQRPGKAKKEEKVKFNLVESIQKLNPQRSVGMKLFIFFFVSIVIIVSTVGTFSFTIARDIIKDKVAFSSEQTIIQAAEKIDDKLGTFERLSTLMLLDKQLKSYLNQLIKMDPVTQAAERGLLVKDAIDQMGVFQSSDKDIYSVIMLPPIGFRNSADSGFNDRVNIKSRNGPRFNFASQYFELWMNMAIDADGAPVWMPTRKYGVFETSYVPSYMLMRYLKNRENVKAEQVLMMEIDVKSFKNALAQVDLGEGGSTMILDQANNIVYHPKYDDIDLKKALKEWKYLGEPTMIPFKETKPSGSYLTRDENGQQILVVYSKLKRSKWTVMGHMPVAVLVKDANKIALVTAAMIVLAIIIAIVLGVIIARMIGRPLAELRILMKNAEQGDLTGRTNILTVDEIGQVGLSYNSMMNEITGLVTRTNASAQSVLDKSYELSDASRQTATSVREISTSTEHISHGAADLATEAEKVGQLTQNLSSQIQNVTNINTEMSHTAEDVQDASQRGVDQMEVLTYKTNKIEGITTSMIAKVDKLKESTDSIQKILSLLNNITKQTNILAINAGIEAARAGVHGKGFMVVANEVRKLADQSKESIKLVEGVTHLIQIEVEETVAVLKDAYPMFQEQIVSVKEVDEIFKDVQLKMDRFIDQIETSTSSIDQLTNAQNVLSDAVSNVSAISEESSATAEEVASLTGSQLVYCDNMVEISQNLEGLSRELRESLTRFRI